MYVEYAFCSWTFSRSTYTPAISSVLNDLLVDTCSAILEHETKNSKCADEILIFEIL